MPSYLVTGGAGFIGSHIAEALVKRGANVVIMDNLSSGRTENVEALAGGVDFREEDVRDSRAVEKALDGVDAVFHQAAIPSVVRSFEDPAETISVNVGGTAVVLEACRKKGPVKVIFASSSAVYGDSPELPKEESMAPQPKSPYALSKLSAEGLLRIYSDVFGMETAALRYFNVFGPRQDPASEYAAVIPRFTTRILEGKRPVIFGDGTQTRDFAYIDNIVHANMRCLETRGLRGEVLNVACGTSVDLLELVKLLNESAQRNLEPDFEPERPGDVKHSLASIRRAEARIGYEVQVALEEGLRKTMDYFRNSIKG